MTALPTAIYGERVPCVYPAKRCCATGCGDSIKGDVSNPPKPTDDTMIRVHWSDGTSNYLEEGCLDWFQNGHPDYGHPYGPIEIHESERVCAGCGEDVIDVTSSGGHVVGGSPPDHCGPVMYLRQFVAMYISEREAHCETTAELCELETRTKERSDGDSNAGAGTG